MQSIHDDHTAEDGESAALDFEPPKRTLSQRAQFALIFGSALLLVALRSKAGRAVLLLAWAGVTGCVIWALAR